MADNRAVTGDTETAYGYMTATISLVSRKLFLDGDSVLSVRVDATTAEELRAEADRTGTSVSAVVRRGIQRVLEYTRALRMEQMHAGGDLSEWEIMPDSGRRGTPRKLDMVFGVRLTSEQMHAILPAAEASGVPLSAFLREAGLRLAAAQAAGGHASCPHMSMSRVTSAECGKCGPLPIAYQMAA